MSELLTGAQILCRTLVDAGVDVLFGYPGGAIMPLYDALEGSGVRHILTRHEQGAVFAAEGYARVTRMVGVAMATSGPGATNLVTGIADAKMDSVPLVCITGQVRTAMIGTDAFQETDVFGTYKRGHFTFGAGFGHFFSGEFIQKTTPGAGPAYLYVFHTYSL